LVEHFVDVLLVQWLDLGGVEGQLLVFFVAFDRDVALVVGFAVCDVAAAKDGVELSSLRYVSQEFRCVG
jgi:hypothetical protein